MATATQKAGSGQPTSRPIHKQIADDLQRRAVVWQRVELVLHGVIFVIVAVVFWEAYQALGRADVSACLKHDQLDATPGYLLAAFTAGGFLAGRGVGWMRSHIRAGLKVDPAPKPSILLELALIAFLAVAALLLFYETWAVANGSNPLPITSYVRCAAYHQFWPAVFTSTTIGFMISSWLWFPSSK